MQIKSRRKCTVAVDVARPTSAVIYCGCYVPDVFIIFFTAVRTGCIIGMAAWMHCAVWCNNNKHHKKQNKSHCFLIFVFSLMDEFENHCHLPGAGLGRRNSAPSSSLAEQLSHSRLGTRRKSTDDRYAIVGICAMAKKVSVRSGDCSPTHYKYSKSLCTFWDRGSAFTLLYLQIDWIHSWKSAYSRFSA